MVGTPAAAGTQEGSRTVDTDSLPPREDHRDVSVAEAAAALRARGFAVCKITPGQKTPGYRGWSARSLEPGDFADGGQLGILGGPLSDGNRPGHALVIIDLDGVSADDADPFLPPTAMVEGRVSKPRSHRYYLVPLASVPTWARSTAEQAGAAAERARGHPGPAIKHFEASAAEAGRLLDFIGTGGQAVCPPSWHTSGQQRRWVGGAPGEPAAVDFGDLWLACCRLAEASGGAMPGGLPWPWEERRERPGPFECRVPPPLTGAAERAVAYLAKCEPAVSGKGGHRRTFAAARAVVYGFDLGADAGFVVLRDHYNPRCVPPWSDRELRHKCEDADRLPYGKPRGYLLDAPPPGRASRNGHAGHGGGGDNGKPEAAAHAQAGAGGGKGAQPNGRAVPAEAPPQSAAALIVAYFRERHRPAFRRGHAIVCADGIELTRAVACAAPDSRLIDLLAGAADAPQYQGGGVNRGRLPGLFRTWAPVAFGDLLAALPDEDAAELGQDAPAREEFRRLVRDALFTGIVFGDVIAHAGATQTERRSVIGWCQKWAKDGPWRQIRDLRCWCKLSVRPDGESVLRVAIQHGLFAQLKADRRLCELSGNTFTRRAKKYDVGTIDRRERPHGLQALILDPAFVAELIGGAPEDGEDEFAHS